MLFPASSAPALFIQAAEVGGGGKTDREGGGFYREVGVRQKAFCNREALGIAIGDGGKSRSFLKEAEKMVFGEVAEGGIVLYRAGAHIIFLYIL